MVSALGDSLVAFLIMTLPALNAGQEWIPPSERSSPTDSMVATCYLVADPLEDLDSVIYWANPITGGGYRRAFAKSVRGREGQRDTSRVVVMGALGAHFFARTKDRSGNLSCQSNEIYFGTVTAVDPVPVWDPVIRTEEVDVHGRKVGKRKASGVYWRHDIHRSGRVTVTKLVTVK